MYYMDSVKGKYLVVSGLMVGGIAVSQRRLPAAELFFLAWLKLTLVVTSSIMSHIVGCMLLLHK